jgi:hypothetical protein
MTLDVLRVEANERVDLADFLFAVDESMRSQSRHWADQFIRDPGRDGPSWVLDGFGLSGVASAQLTVAKGRAILGHRESGEIFYGSLMTEGPVERVVDLSTFANNTYGIYIRFELVEGESGSRAFWNPAGDGSEFAQTISTRRLANWSVRVELTNPGGEWLKIGEVTVSGGSITGVTSERDFFFEGEEHNSYQSQWSAEGGGSANDRLANRAGWGVKSLHTFVAATRQCIEDVKGRGLRRWWEKGIGGMNVGFDNDPIEDTLAIRDAGFKLYHDGTDPYLQWAVSDYFWFDRSTNVLQLVIDTNAMLQIGTVGSRFTGLAISNDLSVVPADDLVRIGDTNFALEYDSNVPTLYFDKGGSEGGWIRYNRTANELQFGTDDNERLELYDGVLIFERGDYGKICVRDDRFSLNFEDNGLPKVVWDTDDYFEYNRTGDVLNLYIGGANMWRTGDVGTRVEGLAVSDGLTVSPSGPDQIRIGHADFELSYDGTDPFIKFESGGYFHYDRSDDLLNLYIGSQRRFYWYFNRAYIFGMTTGDATAVLTEPGEYSYAQQSGVMVLHGPDNAGGADVNEVKAFHATLNRAQEHTDQNLVGAGTYDVLNITMNLKQVAGKVFRLVFWGSVKEHTGSGSFIVSVIVGYSGNYQLVGSTGFTPVATAGTSHNNRDKWRAEALIPILGESASEQPHYHWLSHYKVGASNFQDIENNTYASPFNLTATRLEIIAQISNVVAVTHTFDVCGAFLEEMGGETNAN